ncbi:MAG: GIY-YIG nuclease family protein, partial [Alphaproteobacteria bacterium]|nr:GIY-YIG nuclease family protein [Alphaproteobacteria bacterium]
MFRFRQYCVYILTNTGHSVLYTGVTNDLKRRVYQHREKMLPGFTKRYNVTKPVYYECTQDVRGAIAREKQNKAGSRRKKIASVSRFNRPIQIGQVLLIF